MIGIGKHQAGSQFAQLRRGNRFYGSLGANGCENRRQERAMGSLKYAGSGVPLDGFELEREGWVCGHDEG